MSVRGEAQLFDEPPPPRPPPGSPSRAVSPPDGPPPPRGGARNQLPPLPGAPGATSADVRESVMDFYKGGAPTSVNASNLSALLNSVRLAPPSSRRAVLARCARDVRAPPGRGPGGAVARPTGAGLGASRARNRTPALTPQRLARRHRCSSRRSSTTTSSRWTSSWT